MTTPASRTSQTLIADRPESKMTSITPLKATDLLSLNSINLDVLTENYHLGFYLQYLSDWPAMFFKSTNPADRCTGYMMGKSEGRGLEWHSHITAVTVDCDYRRLGIAKDLVDHLVTCSEESTQDCYFMDLYVRATNRLAIDMYKKFGFSVFRRVVAYYSMGEPSDDGEDAFGKYHQ
ncbi:Nat3p [Sugiyamaella lignohabitans]|uniref:Nat3p n=1 Tax=Sugiyamaella lignohabitans TaxID=796027 RepID=A0A167EXW7_9ASCO|nr:Nat3p [Sugiyamaella lignohabitans]ANB14589.1 Nat3p [Sugiyamaella lignohabitans]